LRETCEKGKMKKGGNVKEKIIFSCFHIGGRYEKEKMKTEM
jgi:hypothetical protein